MLFAAVAPLSATSDDATASGPGVLEVRNVIAPGDVGLESIVTVSFDATRGQLHLTGSTDQGTSASRLVDATGANASPAGASVRGHQAGVVAPDGSTYRLATPSRLERTSSDGQLLDSVDLVEFGLDQASSITLAPSADPTDDTGAMSVYLAGGTAGVVEVAPSAVVVTPTDAATVLGTIDSGAWSPPSPDTSGIAYSAALGRLVVVDGEVEETVDGFSWWAGANVWEASTSGAVSATWNVRLSDGDPAISNEPVGAAVNPANGHLFISDDGEQQIWELDAAHDVVATIDTGAGDPEGLAFGSGSIWVADGVGREVWRIQPGGDGAFGTADDVETHFDVSDWIADPEGIEYDPATGRLFVLSSRRDGQAGSGILDITTTGAFVRVVDLGIAQAIKPAGLAKGPSGTFFVADRGTDFNPDLAPSDGKIFEISIPAASGPPLDPPNTSITAGPTNGSTTTSTGANFSFTGTNGPTSFECRLDAGAYATCTSPRSYTGLSLGSHTFEVRAVNDAGPDPSPASRTWTIEADAGHPFTDIASSPFEADIVWLYDQGITTGCSPTLFCPTGNVLRDQMATFLVRALDLPATGTDFFTDDEGNFHEDSINRLAAAGISTGCGGTKYCPSSPVLRDQMASFLVRAFDLAPSATNAFTDDNGNFHEANINALAAAGVTNGCGGTKYCPSSLVTREQMAAFIHRAVL